MEEEQENRWRVFAKYFTHGIAFSLLFVVLALVGIFIIAFLTLIGSFIGLIIGLGILMVAVGGLNCFLADIIWGIETNTSFWSLLLHGVALFFVLLIVNLILVIGPNLAFPRIETTVITFIIGAFVDGFIGKSLASMFPE